MKLTTTQRKKFRVRNKLKNNSKDDRYRLCVSRSSKNISAQIIAKIFRPLPADKVASAG